MTFDLEKEHIILEAIRQNLPYEACAWRAKIWEGTLYGWLAKGRKELEEDNKNGRYRSFYENVLYEETIKMAEHLRTMETGEKGWQGRQVILERRWRKFFGQDAPVLKELEERIAKLEIERAK